MKNNFVAYYLLHYLKHKVNKPKHKTYFTIIYVFDHKIKKGKNKKIMLSNKIIKSIGLIYNIKHNKKL